MSGPAGAARVLGRCADLDLMSARPGVLERTHLTPEHARANQAVAVARLGGSVAMIGNVGDDDYGRQLHRALYVEGIDCQGVSTCQGVSSGVALITVDAASQNCIVIIPGGNGLLTPQSVHQLGGFHAQARDYDSARDLLDDALALEEAGAFAVVLEAIPHELARLVTERLSIPTSGIGAGPDCEGEIQVLHDVAGWNPDFLPRHSRRFGDSAKATTYIVEQYMEAVRKREFPLTKNSFRISKKVMKRLEGD